MNPRKTTYLEAKQLIKPGLDNLRVFDPHWERDNKHGFFWQFDGDTLLDELSLQSQEYDMDILGIIINGNLRAGHIFTREVEGTMHLIVLGNLTANNIIVGGQDIYVAGSLQVNEVFMGCYNHGTMLVKGYVTCPAIILNDYAFSSMGYVEGTVYGDRCIQLPYSPHDDLKCPEEDQNLAAIFDGSVLDEYGVNFDTALQKVINQQSILLPA